MKEYQTSVELALETTPAEPARATEEAHISPLSELIDHADSDP
jgi:hypothetical protein